MADQLDLFSAIDHTSAAALGPQRATAPDQADRNLVTDALATTLFVEAGAGSGKTTALVQRVVNLILGGVPVGCIAAITFTEKAAAELRHKIRSSLEAAATHHAAAAALAELDQAPIGTLHAFARRLLSEFPVEAELPPQFGCSTRCRAPPRSTSASPTSSRCCSTTRRRFGWSISASTTASAWKRASG
jgi:hypothetical protein